MKEREREREGGVGGGWEGGGGGNVARKENPQVSRVFTAYDWLTPTKAVARLKVKPVIKTNTRGRV